MNLIFMLVSIMSGFTTMERIVAVVGREPILYSQVVENMVSSGLPMEETSEISITSKEYLNSIEELIEKNLIYEAAVSLGYTPSSSQLRTLIEDRIEIMIEQFSSEEDFLSTLTQSGMTLEDLNSQLSNEISRQYAAERFLGNRTYAARSSFPTNIEHYLSTHTGLIEDMLMPREMSWLLIPVMPSDSAVNIVENQLLILRDRIYAGESFDEIASQYSDDYSPSSGSDLGFFGPGEMTPAFEQAAFSLEVGEISEPVTTQYGVHLICLEEKREDDFIRVSHILISIPLTQNDIETAGLRAQEILDEIRSGLPFEEAVLLYSSDGSTLNSGGDLGTILVRWWAPNFEYAIDGLKPGEISDPVLSEDASSYVILKITDDGSSIDWSEFEVEYLEQLVENVVIQENYDSLLDSLRLSIPVVYL